MTRMTLPKRIRYVRLAAGCCLLHCIAGLQLVSQDGGLHKAPEPHDYLSEGSIKGFIGSVKEPEALVTALQACTFKRELVLISVSESSFDAAFQTMEQLRRWGISHVMMVAISEAVCKLGAHIDPFKQPDQPSKLCCVWSDSKLPQTEMARYAFGGHRYLMTVRMRLAARALRLRYNMLFLDTDLIIYDNPYTFFKAPGFRDINLMYAADGQLGANIGVMYVQNAAPNGQVSWVFAEATDRQLRWSEAEGWLKHKNDVPVGEYHHVVWDQPCFSDSALSTVVGFPAFPKSFEYHGKEQPRYNTTWVALHKATINAYVHMTSIRVSGHVSRVATGRDESKEKIQTMVMRHVTNNGTWPLQWGGQGYPPQRGRFSTEWLELLRAQAPDEPMWPSHEAPLPTCSDADITRSQASVAAGQPVSSGCLPPPGRDGEAYTEKLGIFPSFLTNSWWGRGRRDWDYRRDPPTQVIGHALYMPVEKRVYKNVLKMVYGAYDWELAGRVKASINALPAAARPKTPHQGLFLAADEQHPHPRPLRPLPTLPLAEMSLGQFSVALSHLLAAAIALGRAIAWPALPCPDLQRLVQELDRAPWFFEGVRPSGSGVVPYPVSNQPIGAHTAEPDREVIRELNGQVDVSKQVCLWHEACLAQGLGMLPVEADHYDTLFPAPKLTGPHAHRTWQPWGPENTVYLQANASAHPATSQWQPMVASGEGGAGKAMAHDAWVSLFVPTTRAELVAAAAPFQHLNSSLFVGSIPVIVDMHPSGDSSRTLEFARQRCWAIPKNVKLHAYHTTLKRRRRRRSLMRERDLVD